MISKTAGWRWPRLFLPFLFAYLSDGEEKEQHRFRGICWAIVLLGSEVAFPALRATYRSLGRVELIQGRSLPFCRCFTTLITSKQAAPAPPLSPFPPLAFCGHQVNEDADEEEGATERKTDGRTDKSDRRGKDLSCVLSLQGDCEEFVELLMVLREWCLGHTV